MLRWRKEKDSQLLQMRKGSKQILQLGTVPSRHPAALPWMKRLFKKVGASVDVRDLPKLKVEWLQATSIYANVIIRSSRLASV